MQSIDVKRQSQVLSVKWNGTHVFRGGPLYTQDENTSSDRWPKYQETRAAKCDKKEVSFCPPVAAANTQGMFDYCLVSIAEDASTLSDVANES